MRHLASTLRHRPAPLVGVFVALLAAASVVTMAFSMGMSANTSDLPAQRLAGTSVVVTARQDVTFSYGHGHGASTGTVPLTDYRRLPASLAGVLGKIPGVLHAVADRSVPLALELPDGRVETGTSAEPVTGYGWATGYDWPSAGLTPFTLRSGHAPHSADQIVIGTGLARETGLRVGDQVRLVGEPGAPLRVVGLASAPRHDPAGTWSVFLSASEEDALYGHPGQADLIGVVARPGIRPSVLAGRIRTVLAGEAAVAGLRLSVVTATGRGAAEDPAAAYALSNLSSLATGGGLDLALISLFVVASTVALSVAERARTIALLRAVGSTPGQVRRMVMAELALLGVLAGVAAYLPGTWLASMSVRGLAAHQFVPASTRAWTSPVELLPSIGAAVVVAELAGFFAARRASRVHPTAALQEATVERRSPRPARLLLGLAAVAGGVVLGDIAVHQRDASQQLNQAELALGAFMAAVAFLGPYLVRVAEAVLRLPVRLLGATPGRLASAQLRARSRRMASALVAIALPVSFAGAIVAVDATQTHAGVTQGRERLAASAVVTAPGPGLDPSVLAAVRAQPGVTGAVGLVPTTVYVPFQGDENTAAEAVTPGPVTSLLHLHVTSGSLAHFEVGDIALSQLIAGKGALHAHIGETITTYLADGTRYRARVVAVYSRSLGFADALIPSGAAGGGHLGATTLGEVLVETSTGPEELERLAALASRYPGLQVASRSVANAQAELGDSQETYANNLLLALLGVLAAIALANTLVLTTLQGTDDLVLLRRVGATVRELVAMTAWQAMEVTVVGVVLGAGAAVVGVMSATKALTGSWTPTIPWGSAAVIVGSVVGLTALATLAPTARVLSRGDND